MRATAHGLLVLLVGTSIATGAGQEPPPPDAAPGPAAAPTPVPAPPIPAPPVPLSVMDPASLSGFRRPGQPSYARLRRPSPAQDVAMLEAGQPVYSNDQRVAVAAVLLEWSTAVYVEDAPRIAELTIHVTQKVRAANQAASPLEMLAGAVQWNGPGGTRGNVPRKFEDFARLYRSARLDGKDHTSAISLMQPPSSSTPPNGTSAP